MGRISYLILGPLEIREGEIDVALRGGQQRKLLAILLLHAGEAVSSDRLVEKLWDGKPPDTAAKALQGYISSLRKQLGQDTVKTVGSGYRLAVVAEDIDAQRFEDLLAEARSLDRASAAATLRQALALWRGPALADFVYDDFARHAIERLEQLRLTGIERRVDLELALGHHDDLVPELETLVRAHPLHERLRGHLMVALYRSGRQAEALDVYRTGRRLLDQELGLEPDDALQHLEKAILNHDPSLDAPDDPDVRRLAVAQSVVEESHTAALRRRTPVRGEVQVPPDSVAVIDPEQARLVSYVLVGRRPVALAGGHGSVWVANADDGTVSRIAPDRCEVIRTIGIGAPAIDLSVGPDAVWVANGSDGTVSRIDPRADAVVETIDLRGSSEIAWNPTYAVAAESKAVWIAAGPRQVVRIDPETNEPVAIIDVGDVPVCVACGEGAVWVATIAERALRLEPQTNAVTTAVPIGYPVAVTAGDTAVWVSDSRGRVWRINSATGAVTQTIPVLDGAEGIAGRVSGGLMGLCATAAAVWAAVSTDGTVVRIDPENGEVVGRVAIGHSPTDAVPWKGAVWVSTQGESAM
jgi:DNA-binding SARP family transcriptional activator/glutamine cyclotransferase